MGKCYAAKLIEWAWDQVGYHEKATNSNLEDKTANSGSNNWTKYADFIDKNFPNFFNGRKNGYDWCDTFVDCGFLQCFGYENALRLLCQPEKSYGAGCEYSLGYYKNKGQFYTSGPKPGDQIFFGGGIHDVQHTGIVVFVNEHTGTVTTVEGNTGNMVASHTYPLTASNIVGYGRPDYDEPVTYDDMIEKLEERMTALEASLTKLPPAPEYITREDLEKSQDALTVHMAQYATKAAEAAVAKNAKTYHAVEELPKWAEWTKELVQRGIIRGVSETDLALDYGTVRVCEFLGRCGALGEKGVG